MSRWSQVHFNKRLSHGSAYKVWDVVDLGRRMYRRESLIHLSYQLVDEVLPITRVSALDEMPEFT